MKTKIKKQNLLVVALFIIFSASSIFSPSALAATSTCTWTGGGVDSNFLTSANWSCTGTTPGNGDNYNLVFPSSASNLYPVDNIASLSVGSITFTGTFSGAGYDVTTLSDSDVITISGGIQDNSTAIDNEIDANLTLSGSQTFSGNGGGSQLDIGEGYDQTNVGSNTLTLSNASIADPISGTGSIVVDDPNYPTDAQGVQLASSSPSFTGSILVNTGALFVDSPGSFSNATSLTVSSGALLKGSGGTIPTTTIDSGGSVAPGDSPGCLSSSNITLDGNYDAYLGGQTACSGYDQIDVGGNAAISGASLNVTIANGFVPSVGETFTIIEGGSGTTTGVFNGLSEGSTFSVGSTTFQITYRGGSSNNDVILTVIQSSGSSSSATPKSPNTGLAAYHSNPFEVLGILLSISITLTLLSRRLGRQ